MRLALVCDWLTGMRGGERCLEAVCELYPEADIFTLVYVPGSVSQTIESHRITSSYIQRLPGDKITFRRYLPLFLHAMEQFDLSKYDCVLSFSHCVAKGAKAPTGVPHLCYCFTPMRYAWYMRDEYLSGFACLKRRAAAVVLDWLRVQDRKTASRVTHFIGISSYVQDRIKRAYNRDSRVIYPAVDCRRFRVCDAAQDYYLMVGALVPYKRAELAVKAFGCLDRKLVVVGNGPELSRLKSIAASNVSFDEDADDSSVAEYMQNCRALIFPGEEDFGIVPLEAQASGKPVIAFGKGGALETVIGFDESKNDRSDATGIFFYEQTPEALCRAVAVFEKSQDSFAAHNCRANALRFDRSLYKSAMRNYITEVTAEQAS